MDHETEKWVVTEVLSHKSRLDGHDDEIGALKKRPAVALSWDVRLVLYAVLALCIFMAVRR